MSVPSDLISLGGGIWRDRLGNRFLTDAAVEERTGIPRSTFRGHARSDASVFRAIDRGPGRKPRWLTPESDVADYVRRSVGARTDPAPVQTLVEELLAENLDLRREVADLRAELGLLEAVVDRVRAASDETNRALDAMAELARRRSGRF